MHIFFLLEVHDILQQLCDRYLCSSFVFIFCSFSTEAFEYDENFVTKLRHLSLQVYAHRETVLLM